MNEEIRKNLGEVDVKSAEVRRLDNDLQTAQSRMRGTERELNLWRKLVLEQLLGYAEAELKIQLERLDLAPAFIGFELLNSQMANISDGSGHWLRVLPGISPAAPFCILQAVKVWYRLVEKYPELPFYEDLHALVFAMHIASPLERWFSLMAIEAGVFAMATKDLKSNWSEDICRAYLRAIELLCRCYDGMMTRLSSRSLKSTVDNMDLTRGMKSKLNFALRKHVSEVLSPQSGATQQSWLGRILDDVHVDTSVAHDEYTFIAEGTQIIVLERPQQADLPVRVFDAANHV